MEPFYLFAWEAVEQIRTIWPKLPKIKVRDTPCVQGSQEETIEVVGAARNEGEKHYKVNQHGSGAEEDDLYQDVDYDRMQHEERFEISTFKPQHLRQINVDENDTLSTSSQFEHWLHRG